MSLGKRAHPSHSDGREPKPFRESELYHRWYNSVASGKPNDYIIAITAHPGYTQTSGTGKTTMAGGLAKEFFDLSPGGFNAEKQYTLDINALAHRLYPQTDVGACLVGDEMQGTAATSNFNSKRSQKNEALEAYAAIAGGRKDRKTVILVFQTLKKANKDLFDFIDSWLLIMDDVNYRANHYAIVPDVFDLSSTKLKTPGIETLTWDPLPADDPDYKIMEEKKDRANRGERESAGEEEEEDTELPDDVQIEIAQAYRDLGYTLREIEQKADRVTYSREWIRRNTEKKSANDE